MNFYPARSVRIGPWKYLRNLDSSLEFHSHVDRMPKDTGYWPSWERDAQTDPVIAGHVQRYLHRPAEELYNLESDPDELTSLAAQPEHAAELARLRAAVDEWMATLGDKGHEHGKGTPAQTQTRARRQGAGPVISRPCRVRSCNFLPCPPSPIPSVTPAATPAS